MKQQRVFVGSIEQDGPAVRVGLEPVDGFTVTEARSLPPRTDVVDYRTSGFNWGYHGFGPSQLALAILVELIGVEKAKVYHQAFKDEVISRLPQDKPWVLTEAKVWEALRRMDGWIE